MIAVNISDRFDTIEVESIQFVPGVTFSGLTHSGRLAVDFKQSVFQFVFVRVKFKTALKYSSERLREQYRKGSKQPIFLASIDIFKETSVSMMLSIWYRYRSVLSN